MGRSGPESSQKFQFEIYLGGTAKSRVSQRGHCGQKIRSFKKLKP